MAQQETNQDHLEAALAAAAIADDIDAAVPSSSDRKPTGSQTMEPASVSEGKDETPIQATTFLVIKDVRSISRARSLRLQPEDMVVAIDGALSQGYRDFSGHHV